MLRRLVVAAWLGFALAALFFYSLAVALDTDIYYLQWQAADLIEAGVALLLLALAFAVVIYLVWPRADRAALLILLAAAALPLASFAAGLARQLPFDDALRALGQNGVVRFAAPAAVLGLIATGVVFWPRGFLRGLRLLLVLVSPVSLVVVESLITSASDADAVVRVSRRLPARGAEDAAAGCDPVLAVLFDELSFSYLYADARVRPEYSAIAATASQATNYLAMSAPGPETLVSMPSFLATRHLRDIRVESNAIFELDAEGHLLPFTAGRPEALFPTARRLGFSTEMAGYYLPYCEMLDGLLDACQSLSFYNMSSVDDGFSVIDPLMTTLILWPRQFPFGLLKNPPFARLQRGLVENTATFAMQSMHTGRPVFRFVHFSVPHFPFVFDGQRFNPPFDPLRTSPDNAYRSQVRYVDRLFGTLTQHMRDEGTYDSTTIVVLADHGFRFGGIERNPRQIPFIVKGAGQRERADVATPMRGEVALKQVIEDACRPR
jgi:hypothetical protein